METCTSELDGIVVKEVDEVIVFPPGIEELFDPPVGLNGLPLLANDGRDLW